MQLTNNIKKRFSKDFRLPINVFQEPYFEYFVELYDPVFQVREKLVWLENAIDHAGGYEAFFSEGERISRSMKERISQSVAYKNFNNADMNQAFPLVEQIKQQNIYIEPNMDKNLISIDLQKANFNCFNLFQLKEEINAQSYDEFMRQFTTENYFLNSKMIRQVIFGDLNPSRQQRLQKYIINQLCTKLKQAGCELSSASSDEIIVQNADNRWTPTDIKDILKDIPENMQFFRVEDFSFTKIDKEHDFFLKTTITPEGEEKIEFKNVPGHLFAQVYKKHFSLAPHDYDMLFYHEGFLAQFKDPLFAEVRHDKKNKPK